MPEWPDGDGTQSDKKKRKSGKKNKEKGRQKEGKETTMDEHQSSTTLGVLCSGWDRPACCTIRFGLTTGRRSFADSPGAALAERNSRGCRRDEEQRCVVVFISSSRHCCLVGNANTSDSSQTGFSLVPQVPFSGRRIWATTTAEIRGLVLLERCVDATGKPSVFADIVSCVGDSVSS